MAKEPRTKTKLNCMSDLNTQAKLKAIKELR